MSPNQKTRKTLSLATKVRILDKLEVGERVCSVSAEYNVNESTIRTIRKNADQIRAAVVVGRTVTSNEAKYTRPAIITKLEEGLHFWIRDCGIKRIPLDTATIREKALAMYSRL